MRRCVVCRARPRALVYQPWPDGAWRTPGRHLDGYPVVSVCDACAGGLRSGLPRTFRWRGQLWTLAGGTFTLSDTQPERRAMC